MTFLFGVAIINLGGCEQISSLISEPDVLYVDLAAVAKALGRDQSMQMLLGDAKLQLNT